MGQLHAGVGRVHLTPAIGNWLIGFAGRAGGCTSIHDELYATALVCDDGDHPLAIVSCDILSLHPDLVHKTRALVHEATGIPEHNVMVCCTHTHSGPAGYATTGSRPIDQAHAAYLPYRIAGAVQLAFEHRAPARLGHGSGATAIGINRRQVVGEGQTILGENPAGPMDDEVGVLRIDRVDGTPIATVVNYACHPVILGPRSLVVSADFVGRTREAVEAATGTHMLFIQGACGDINPLGGVREDYANCERLGTILADEIVRVFGTIESHEDALRLASDVDVLEVATAPLAPSETPATSPNIVNERLDQEFPWAPDPGTSGPRLEVQAFAVGDLGIVATACEPFVETGLATKQRSPFSRTFFAGYSNGCVGYIPTAAAYPHGGYEVQTAQIFYRIAEPVVPATEQRLVQACADSLARVAKSVE